MAEGCAILTECKKLIFQDTIHSKLSATVPSQMQATALNFTNQVMLRMGKILQIQKNLALQSLYTLTFYIRRKRRIGRNWSNEQTPATCSVCSPLRSRRCWRSQRHQLLSTVAPGEQLRRVILHHRDRWASNAYRSNQEKSRIIFMGKTILKERFHIQKVKEISHFS